MADSADVLTISTRSWMLCRNYAVKRGMNLRRHAANIQRRNGYSRCRSLDLYAPRYC